MQELQMSLFQVRMMTQVRRMTTEAPKAPAKAAASVAPAKEATPVPPTEPVGPGALKTGDYKNAEYFCYDKNSYFDLEAEMVVDRCPQPTAGNHLM